ncbi:Ivy family c-type lysozyme inhibitor [Rhizobium sp. NPDC090279]|uniref:Ivy family c-type lysozyme inhibitor n=1 Tax=Rhizobium sp. NPDC090279 TaxID=3364499 RepID=UPI00383B00F8
MKKIVRVIALTGALVVPYNGVAQANDFRLHDIPSGPAARKAFEEMAKGHALPEWVRGGSTDSETVKLAFDGNEVYVMSGCKRHDCIAEKMAVIYNPKGNIMYGVFATWDEKTSTEKLIWLNIGGGEESMDGKTILYAALTGSLGNHPGAFNYK